MVETKRPCNQEGAEDMHVYGNQVSGPQYLWTNKGQKQKW